MVAIFGDVVPKCCIMRVALAWKWYRFWGQYHEEGENTCWNCGYPAYRIWVKSYSGYRGICTRCNTNWAES